MVLCTRRTALLWFAWDWIRSQETFYRSGQIKCLCENCVFNSLFVRNFMSGRKARIKGPCLRLWGSQVVNHAQSLLIPFTLCFNDLSSLYSVQSMVLCLLNKALVCLLASDKSVVDPLITFKPLRVSLYNHHGSYVVSGCSNWNMPTGYKNIFLLLDTFYHLRLFRAGNCPNWIYY